MKMKMTRILIVGTLAVSFLPTQPAVAHPLARYADVLSRTRVPFQSWDMGAGFGSLWVSGDLGVSRIDPNTSAIVAEVSVGAVAGVAVGRAGVFVSSYANDRVARVDPSTNDILWSTRVRGPLRIALGEGGLWASSPVAGTVSRIDPNTGRVVDTITIQQHVPAASGVGTENDDRGFAPGIAAGGGSVWVASRTLGRLVQIDPVTDRVSARIRTGGSDPIDVSVGGGVVWVTDFYAKIIDRVDPKTERVRTYPLPGYGGQIAVGERGVWVTDLKANHPQRSGIVRIDPRSGRIERFLRIKRPPPPKGFWSIGPGFGSLWVTTFNGESTVDDLLFKIDPAGSLPRPSVPPVMEPEPGVLPVNIAQDVPLTSGHSCTVPGRHCEQLADVYAPASPGQHPVVVFAHEDCGQSGCKRYLAAIADVLSVDGAVVFNAEFADPQNEHPHRRMKGRDLACAVRFARARAADYGGDPARVTLVTHLSASWTGAAVALGGVDHVAHNCLVRHGSALPDAFVGIADAPNRHGTPPLGENPDLEVRLIAGAHDARVAPAAFRRVGAFRSALQDAGYDATVTVVQRGAYADSPATYSNIDVGSAYPTIRIILSTAR